MLDILHETWKLGRKPASLPIEKNYRISLEKESVKVDKGQYQWFVEKLIYLAHTRTYLSYFVSMTTQFMHDLSERHLQVIGRFLQYLKVAIVRGLLFKTNGSLTMKTYTNVENAWSVCDERSTLGYCTFLRGNPFLWGVRNKM